MEYIVQQCVLLNHTTWQYCRLRVIWRHRLSQHCTFLLSKQDISIGTNLCPWKSQQLPK